MILFKHEEDDKLCYEIKMNANMKCFIRNFKNEKENLNREMDGFQISYEC